MTPGQQIAAEVAAAIREGSASVGDGTPLVGHILRPGPADTSVYPPVQAGLTGYPCNLILTAFKAKDVDGTNVRSTDMMASVAPDAATAPVTTDLLLVGGAVYNVIDVMTLKPGGTVIKWDLQVRETGQPVPVFTEA